MKYRNRPKVYHWSSSSKFRSPRKELNTENLKLEVKVPTIEYKTWIAALLSAGVEAEELEHGRLAAKE